MKNICICFIIALLSLTACIEDGFTSAPADQPTFSADSVDMGVIFTGELSTTESMRVFNPHSKGLNISRISISGPAAEYFRINVDGISGDSFSDVEIRAKDSIFVLIEARLPESTQPELLDFTASLDFVTNGVSRSVVLYAQGQNATRLRGITIDEDTRLTADLPYQIYDSLIVSPGVTVTIEPGAVLCFHDKSYMTVRGTLIAKGTPEQRITLAGDRMGKLVADIDFEIMSRQWQGLGFSSTSSGNLLTHCDIKNTVQGVAISGDGLYSSSEPQLTLINCRLRNSAYTVLEAYHSAIRAVGCEFAEGGGGLVYLYGGDNVFNHCTFANYYLYSVLSGPAIGIGYLSAEEDSDVALPFAKADFTNSIVYGLGTCLSQGDFTDTDIYFRRCLFKDAGTDDDHFIESIWDQDPLYYTVRNDYFFDYRLQPKSPAIAASDPSLTLPEAAIDGYGLTRGETPDLGAYVFTPPTE